MLLDLRAWLGWGGSPAPAPALPPDTVSGPHPFSHGPRPLKFTEKSILLKDRMHHTSFLLARNMDGFPVFLNIVPRLDDRVEPVNVKHLSLMQGLLMEKNCLRRLSPVAKKWPSPACLLSPGTRELSHLNSPRGHTGSVGSQAAG